MLNKENIEVRIKIRNYLKFLLFYCESLDLTYT